MFRLALRAAPRAVPRVAVPISARAYSAAALTKEDITKRVMDVLRSFEKVDQGKLTPTANFTKDLGLDSLDTVEVVMAVEEEFAIEIPDQEADAINAVNDAIEYVAQTPEAH
ncbi:hypothetical protein A1Q2_08283 [Trichosporon asahii var. asahii CBS 8904]|uniref:Acyl carrier protein n=2 Tax=Trichosporon asahii var. asahii TaxID=189963 RepID=K1V9E9_TRIAC|nr:hypothetical protein A1Q1_02307 [Trichosporon asahii var. asahii CBS 2479]EJT48670.1 hypothetical protein A1Q1_02307 [Trichosporon asahii var. asahii CBS 2479]EKC97360.1 hypothetical protein A1Q2_08283 [Trichosporon asahii var. asahii CBS 8904]